MRRTASSCATASPRSSAASSPASDAVVPLVRASPFGSAWKRAPRANVPGNSPA